MKPFRWLLETKGQCLDPKPAQVPPKAMPYLANDGEPCRSPSCKLSHEGSPCRNCGRTNQRGAIVVTDKPAGQGDP